jgi:hypothetical protein
MAVLLGLLTSVPLGSNGVAAAASSDQAYCGIHWSSQTRTHRVFTYTSATIEDLRAGRHGCFDRLVVDLGAPQSGLPGPQGHGYRLKYVPEVLRDASGLRVPMQGGAYLMVVVNAPAHDADYQPTYEPRDPIHAVDVSGFRTFRQVAFLGTYEAQTEIAVGVRARLPFRAFVLSGPGCGSRLVIDVAHRW